MKTNPWLELARSHKTIRLIEEIDRAIELAIVGLSPEAIREFHEYVPGTLAAAPDDWWARVAANAACRPPSRDTMAAVVEHYRKLTDKQELKQHRCRWCRKVGHNVASCQAWRSRSKERAQ